MGRPRGMRLQQALIVDKTRRLVFLFDAADVIPERRRAAGICLRCIGPAAKVRAKRGARRLRSIAGAADNGAEENDGARDAKAARDENLNYINFLKILVAFRARGAYKPSTPLTRGGAAR